MFTLWIINHKIENQIAKSYLGLINLTYRPDFVYDWHTYNAIRF